MATLERLIHPWVPDEWFERGPVHVVRLDGDDVQLVAPGESCAYVVIPPAPELEPLWPTERRVSMLQPEGSCMLAISSTDDEPYAEIHCCDGMFRQAILSARGEEALGETLHEWQTIGVPVLEPALQGSCVLVLRAVGLHDATFFSHAAQWLAAYGHRVAVSSGQAGQVAQKSSVKKKPGNAAKKKRQNKKQ